jgi:hypothetical protein
VKIFYGGFMEKDDVLYLMTAIIYAGVENYSVEQALDAACEIDLAITELGSKDEPVEPLEENNLYDND